MDLLHILFLLLNPKTTNHDAVYMHELPELL